LKLQEIAGKNCKRISGGYFFAAPCTAVQKLVADGRRHLENVAALVRHFRHYNRVF